MPIKIILVFVTAIIIHGIPTRLAAKEYCSTQVLAEPISGGYSWTLASRVGQLLIDAEKRFGKRDQHWTLLGVEFTSDQQPQIWYPYSGDGQQFIIIQLTKSAANDEKKSLFQLAHEVIHILSPTGGDAESNVFEEGLATYFAIDFMQKNGYAVTPDYIRSKKYLNAYNAIQLLYKEIGLSKTNSMIQLIRFKHGGISNLTIGQLLVYFPTISKQLATTLASKFS